MAKVYMSGGGSSKPEQAITFKNFMGVDFTSSKFNVAQNRATNMKNNIHENGVNRKRPSWNEVAKGNDKVNGVWKYVAPDKSTHIIAHIGTDLYKVFKRDETTSGFDINSVYTKLTKLTLPNGVTITNEISYAVANEEKLFILCGVYLVYDGTTVKRVKDIAYVPTTTIGIGANRSTLYANTRTPYEKENMLSTHKRITLYGESLSSFDAYTVSAEAPLIYRLDGIFQPNGEPNKYTALQIKIKSQYGQYLSDIILDNYNAISGTVDIIDYDKSPNLVGRLGSDILELYTYYPVPDDGKPNIEITYKTKEVSDTIDKCAFGTIFNAQGGQFLFLSGNPDKPNYDWHSEYGLTSNMKTMSDFTYFPENNYTTIGTQNEENIGYTILGDGQMAIHKKAIQKQDLLYIRNSFLGNAINPSGETLTDVNGNPLKEVFFTINQSLVGEGMIARHTSDNLLGDTLFLSRNGVYGLALSSNITSSERFALDRSYFINGKLTQEENLEKACAIAYNGKYYLSVNGNCYVADARFKNYVSTDMPDTFSYEWWFWENIPARLFFVIDNELYFGTEQGQICKFMFDRADLNDKTYVEVDSITYYDGLFILDSQYEELIETLKDGDGIRIKEVVGGAELDLQYTLYDDQEEYNLMDFEVPIAKVGNGFRLVNHTSEDGSNVYYNIEPRLGHQSFKAYFILKNKVVSFFTLPITNLGTSILSKKITGTSITPEKIVGSKATIIIRTRNFKEKSIDVSNAGLFDFNDLDFANFSFDTDNFYTSITKKLNIKCNYVELTFLSNNDRDSILHEISLTFKTTNKNRGVK